MSSLIAQLITRKTAPVIKAQFPPFLVNFLQAVLLPTIGIIVFLLFWSVAANNINTSLGKFPGPSAVATQVGNLYNEHVESREKEQAFYERQKTVTQLVLLKIQTMYLKRVPLQVKKRLLTRFLPV